MIRLLAKFTKDETGATAIEYALLCGFIGLLIIVSVASMGSSLNTIFAVLQTGLDSSL